MATKKQYQTHEEAHKAGYFSCRYANRTNCDAARTKWEQHQQAKVDNAKVRQEIRAKRSASEQVIMLDQHLGVGVGAVRERARLAASLTLAPATKT